MCVALVIASQSVISELALGIEILGRPRHSLFVFHSDLTFFYFYFFFFAILCSFKNYSAFHLSSIAHLDNQCHLKSIDVCSPKTLPTHDLTLIL